MIVAGVMSGTSLDGIDVAIIDIQGKRIRPLAFHSTPYPKAVREALLGVSNAIEAVNVSVPSTVLSSAVVTLTCLVPKSPLVKVTFCVRAS